MAKKRTSAKKQTPGKRKTPISMKRLIAPPPESSRASSKRALFMSPVEEPAKPPPAPKELPMRGRLPIRSLFSSTNDENRKRRPSRSPDHDAENRGMKFRRVDSPAKMLKTQSFSIASSSSSSRSAINKGFLYRTQSEVGLPMSSPVLGYKKPMDKEKSKKLLWAVSTTLKTKQISSGHEKFKDYATVLAKLVKTVFMEFFDPSKGVSEQMSKFAGKMVNSVVTGRPSAEILEEAKAELQTKNVSKLTGYISHQDFVRNQPNLFMRNSSLMMASQSCSSLNFSHQSDSSFLDNISYSSVELGGSNSSLNRSNSSLNRSSSKNYEGLALRENFIEKSAKKLGGSESNISNIGNISKTTSSSSLLKAKRQISF